MDKNKLSKKAFAESQNIFPGGVNSPVRAFKNVNSLPVFIEKGNGAYIYDLDGNKYIDYIGSWGPMIMGHSHPEIIKAVSRQLQLGTSYGAPTSIESSTAVLIKECMPSIKKIRIKI